MRWWMVAAALLGLGAGACGSKGSSTPASELHLCAPDGGAWVTIPSPDAGAGTAAVALPCPGAISDYCYHYSCPQRTWAAALASQNAVGSPSNLYVCDPYDWSDYDLVCNGVNRISFAYDKTTGALVGAVESSAPGEPYRQTCLAGPPTLAPFGSCTTVFDCRPNDAGFSRGTCFGDGGVDGAGHGG